METNDCCVRCGAPKSTGPECPKCGVIYAKAESQRVTPKRTPKKTVMELYADMPLHRRLLISITVGIGACALTIGFTTLRDSSRHLPVAETSAKILPKPVQHSFSGFAHIQCKRLVKQMLKAPATANFPFTDHTETDIGNKTYQVVSYVDAQNSFGAKIRNNWTCTMHYKSGDPFESSSWELLDINVE